MTTWGLSPLSDHTGTVPAAHCFDIFGLSLCQAECACVRWTVRIHSGCRALKSDMIEAFGREKIEKPNKIRGLAGEKILCSVR